MGAVMVTRSGQTSILALMLMATALAASAYQGWRKRTAVPFRCDHEALRIDGRGVIGCFEGAPLPAGARLTMGLKLNLNEAGAEELMLIPGIGPAFAKALVEARIAA